MMAGASTVPELSVVIPAFNAEGTLDEQLSALARQKVPFEWQILVCDNGSTDGTAGLVRDWTRRLPQLVLVDASARRGPAAARNVGARRARSPLLAFCDADDVVADDWVVNIHAALQQNDLVAGITRRIQLGSRPEAPQYYQFGPYRISRFPYLLAAAANNLAVRRAVFEQVGGFDESLRTGEDDDLCWRIQLAGYPLTTRPEVNITAGGREGVKAVFAQAFGYGRGDRQLLHKYAQVIAALDGENNPLVGRLPAVVEVAIDPHTDTVDTATAGRLRRRLGRLARLRRLSDLSDVAHRLGLAIGFRVGPFDRGAPQLDPDVVFGGADR